MSASRIVCVGLLVAVGLCVSANGAPSYMYDGPAQATYLLFPGDRVDVPVYLVEIAPPPASSLLVSEGGLFSAGVLIQQTSSSSGAPATLTGLTANPTDFNDPLGSPLTIMDNVVNSASISETCDLFGTGGVLPSENPAGSGIRRVYLGTVTVSASSKLDVSTFQVTRNGSDDTTTWASSMSLDAEINSISFAVETVFPGDANRDGIVDQADYTVWYNHYGASGGWADGDFTHDGVVDQADYTVWYNHYGFIGGSVPEPVTLSLLAVGGLAMLRRRK